MRDRINHEREIRLSAESASGGLKGGSGDGTNGGMEARVAKLEAHMEHIREDVGRLKDVPVELAALKTKVDHLPTKGWMVTALCGALSVVAALVAFAEKIQLLVH